MDDLEVSELEKRYEYKELKDGISETRPLDFHSPYGCSKGVADQYCIDYSRIYDLRTVSLRQSCIYGPRQFGIEDQGWVAWFTIAAVLGKSIAVYGDGKQIRDVLYVDDLLQAYELAILNKDRVNGQAFNIGGGVSNTLSLLELLALLEVNQCEPPSITWSDWRPGDQKVFVCDTKKANDLMGWQSTTSVESGLATLIDWTRRHKALLGQVLLS
jgi:CDP-paratose 2-epimerase